MILIAFPNNLVNILFVLEKVYKIITLYIKNRSSEMKIFKPVIAVFAIVFLLLTLPVLTIAQASNVNTNLSFNSNSIDNSERDAKILSILELIDEDLLRGYLEVLVGYGPRFTGTYGCEKSARFIYDQFTGMGLNSRFQNWSIMGNEYAKRYFISQNVEGVLPGTLDAKAICFNAHYDTVFKSPGANDDGSGTAAVLAAAYALSHFDFKHSIRFITFSGEEVGLLGSSVYAKECYKNGDDIIVDFNADMIGRATTPEGGSNMGFSYTDDADWIINIFEDFTTLYNINFGINTYHINRDGPGYSDYFPFVQYGYEAIACWQGEHDPNMHKKTDTLDNINFSYLVNTTRMIVSVIAHIADSENLDTQVRIESPRMGYLYWKGMKLFEIDSLRCTVLGKIHVWADVKYDTDNVDYAEFYYDGKLMYTDQEYPYRWFFNKISLREHRVKVIVYDENGGSYSDYIDIRFLNFKKIKEIFNPDDPPN